MHVVVAAAALLLVIMLAPAHAQTIIDAGGIFGAWRPYLTEIAAILISAFMGWVLNLIRKRTGLEIEAKHRDALQTALTNAAGLVINRAGDAAAALKIDVGHPKIAEAVSYVLRGAPDAIKHFGITPDALRSMVFAKVGVVASTPAAAPNA